MENNQQDEAVESTQLEEKKPEQNLPAIPEIVKPQTFPSQIELAKYPQLFGTKSIPHPRAYGDEYVLKKPQPINMKDKDGKQIIVPAGTVVIEKVSVGVNHTLEGPVRGLTTEHDRLIGLLRFLREKQGSDEVKNSLSKIFDILKDGSDVVPRRHRRSGSYKAYLAPLIDDLMEIVFGFSSVYRTPDGEIYDTKTTFKVLKKRDLFERKKGVGKYFDFSVITFDSSFIEAIATSRYKLKRLDQMVKMKKPGSRKIYGELDWVMWDKFEFRRDIFDLATELDIGRKRKDNIVADFRSYCKELKGLQFTHGYISDIRVEKSKDGSKWILYIKKLPLPPMLEVKEEPPAQATEVIPAKDFKPSTKPTTSPPPPPPPDPKKEEEELDDYHKKLSSDEKLMVEMYMEEEILRCAEKYRAMPFSQRFAFLDAVRRHMKEMEKEDAGAELAAFYVSGKREPQLCREPAPEPYGCEKRSAEMIRLIKTLNAFAEKKIG